MGYAFVFPIFKIFGGCKVACYIHYPTISTDMLSDVSQQKSRFNNSKNIATSPWKTKAKLMYDNNSFLLFPFFGSPPQLKWHQILQTLCTSLQLRRFVLRHDNGAESLNKLKKGNKICKHKHFIFFPTLLQVNSTWTCDHIEEIWGIRPSIVYPPCGTNNLEQILLAPHRREQIIISIGQFRSKTWSFLFPFPFLAAHIGTHAQA
jgi:alpha-1,2-mannosyltransferase